MVEGIAAEIHQQPKLDCKFSKDMVPDMSVLIMFIMNNYIWEE